MQKKPLYTIGHGSRKAETFLGLLQRYGIDYLADVRSRPYSRFHPQFNRNRLDDLLREHGIAYVFMGDTLGGRPDDPSCYKEGRVDYGLVREKPFFSAGLARLKTAYAKNLSVAIMCSESKPQDCHRTRLIAAGLDAEAINVQHIDEKGILRSHEDIMQKQRIPPGLFDLG